MVKRSKRLQPVLHIASLKTEKAVQALGVGQQRLILEQSKLQQLQDYLKEYEQQVVVAGKAGLAVKTYLSHQQFISRLVTAIEQQKNQIQVVEGNVQLLTQAWQKVHAHQKGLEKVIEKAELEERALADKRDQQAMDERYQRVRSTFS